MHGVQLLPLRIILILSLCRETLAGLVPIVRVLRVLVVRVPKMKNSPQIQYRHYLLDLFFWNNINIQMLYTHYLFYKANLNV